MSVRTAILTFTLFLNAAAFEANKERHRGTKHELRFYKNHKESSCLNTEMKIWLKCHKTSKGFAFTRCCCHNITIRWQMFEQRQTKRSHLFASVVAQSSSVPSCSSSACFLFVLHTSSVCTSVIAPCRLKSSSVELKPESPLPCRLGALVSWSSEFRLWASMTASM